MEINNVVFFFILKYINNIESTINVYESYTNCV